MYGPHTLAAYQQSFYGLATKLARNESVPDGPQPYDMRGKTFSFVVPPIPDGKLLNNVVFSAILFLL